MGEQLTAGAVSATYDSHGPNEVHFFRNACRDSVGALAGGYFADLTAALGQAKLFVFIADWSFHPAVVLRRDRLLKDPPYGPEHTVGRLLGDVAKRDVLVAVHTWNHVDIAMKDDHNDDGGDWLDRVNGGKRPSNLLWRSSRRTDPTSSHHQKFVVLDAPADPARPEAPERVLKVFLGGIDLTMGRHDFHEHPNMPDSAQTERHRVPTEVKFTKNGTAQTARFGEWYNPEFVSVDPNDARALNPDYPRQTWHDIHAVLIGPTAWDVVHEFVGRWNSETLTPSGDTSPDAAKQVLDLFERLQDDPNVAKPGAPFGGKDSRWRARIIRSIVKSHWTPPQVREGRAARRKATMDQFRWTLPADFEKSIQDTYIDAILRAKRFIYIETQYFIGSGDQWRLDAGQNTTINNKIPQALVQKVIESIRAGKPFHVYVVMPLFPEGDPVSAAPLWQRFFEFQTMKFMAKAIDAEAIPKKKRWFDFVSFAFPARWDHVNRIQNFGDRAQRTLANRRYMVYVHSKLMIVDDQMAIVGSANLNERSLAGDRDTEICVFVEPFAGKEQECAAQLGEFRKLLWEEHLLPRPVDANLLRFLHPDSPLRSPGNRPPTRDPAWDRPETPACVTAVMREAIRNYMYLRRGLRVVFENDPDRGLIEFVHQGQLVAFPLDFVDGNHLPSLTGKFGSIHTANIRPENPEGLMSRATADELRLLLGRLTDPAKTPLHPVPDGEDFLPDPTFSAADPSTRQLWRWESQPGPGGAELFAE